MPALVALDHLPVGSDSVVEVTALNDPFSDQFVNTATVTAVLTDLKGVEVAGQNWPLDLDYVVGSDGVYRGMLEDGLQLVAGKNYVLWVTADAGADLIKKWRLVLPAKYER